MSGQDQASDRTLQEERVEGHDVRRAARGPERVRLTSFDVSMMAANSKQD